MGVTCSAEQHWGVGDTQQGVVKEALQHRCVHMEARGQILGGDGRPTDEPSQTLTHGQRLRQLPERERWHSFNTSRHLGMSSVLSILKHGDQWRKTSTYSSLVKNYFTKSTLRDFFYFIHSNVFLAHYICLTDLIIFSDKC